MKTLIFAVVWLISSSAVAQEGLVMHWDDGSTMTCRFLFEPEEVYELDPTALPVTVSDAYEMVREWSISGGGSEDPLIRNYRLNFVRPNGYTDGIWAWFMEYIPTSAVTDPTPVRMSDFSSIAVTMRGQIIEGQC